MKNNVNFYRHETGSHNHWKFKKLRRKFQWAGEGRFWAINNLIAEADHCKLDLSNPDKLESIAIDLDMDPNELISLLSYLVTECKLIKQDENGFYYTEHVQEVLVEVMKKRNRDRNQKSLAKIEKSLANNSNSYMENQQRKVKERKENVDYITPPPSDVKILLLEQSRVKESWLQKGYTQKLTDGIDAFVIQSSHQNKGYKNEDDLIQHFINWMQFANKALYNNSHYLRTNNIRNQQSEHQLLIEKQRAVLSEN